MRWNVIFLGRVEVLKIFYKVFFDYDYIEEVVDLWVNRVEEVEDWE